MPRKGRHRCVNLVSTIQMTERTGAMTLRDDAGQAEVPAYDELMWPTLLALRSLGDSGSIDEINTKVAEVMGLTESQLQVLHQDGPQTKIGYRMHWSRSYLRMGGAIENVSRGVWAVTEAGRTMSEAEVQAIKPMVRAMYGSGKKKKSEPIDSDPEEVDPEPDEIADLPIDPNDKSARTFTSTDPEEWQDALLETLLEMAPSAFERLCQRVLRESGFTKVEVTGRSGDGGIDGIGVLRMSLLSFQVFFQCKRYRGSVGAGSIRDFRGAMVGRTDKGLFITTGTFTTDAVREASRDGAPVLDLIDGEELCSLLKNLNLGLKTEMVEAVTVNRDWYQTI